MPGINDYLNTLFQSEINQEINARFEIKPLALIDLQVLYNFMMRKGTFAELDLFIDRYNKMLTNRKKKFYENPNTDTFLKSVASFDDIYNSIYLQELKDKQLNKAEKESLFQLLGINQEELDTIV